MKHHEFKMIYRASRHLLLLACTSALFGQVDVLTANYDNNRTNANLGEFILNTSNLNPTQFGKLHTFPVDGEVYAQPLYVHSVSVPGKGNLNLLIVATMHDSVYAFDADAKKSTAPVWKVNFGTSVNPHDFDLAPDPKALPLGFSYDDILNEIGILSTPVIDRATRTIYVVHYAYGNDSQNPKTYAYYLHALDLATGQEKFNGPVLVQATVTGRGWGGQDVVTSGEYGFNAAWQLQRPGLLLLNGIVYLGFGSHGDLSPWHGWLLGYRADNLQQAAVFNTTPNGAAAAIWQGGRGLAADNAGNIYLATGNGNYDGTQAWAQSVLRLSVDGGVSVTDYFTPDEWNPLNMNDTDVGSSGPVLIPGTNLLYSIGKDGELFVLDRGNLGHQSSMNGQVVQHFQAAAPGISMEQEEKSSFVFNTALWARAAGPILYLWPQSSHPQPVPLTLHSFQMAKDIFDTKPFSTNVTDQFPNPRFGMSLSAYGSLPETGILWTTTSTTRQLPAPAILHAFDALDLTQELWNSDMDKGGRDTLGNFVKFANPTIANGKVFVPTASGEVVVYGLLPGVPGIDTVVNSAGLQGSAIAPGELISIFGGSIGPAQGTAGIVNPAGGRIPSSLGSAKVTFDDKPAALLYAGPNQINAVAPFSIAGKSSVKMTIATPDGKMFNRTLSVANVAPAIFTRDSSGSGQGSIVNLRDASPNSAGNPAARGHAVSIFVTGMGVTTPAGSDGHVAISKQRQQVSSAVTVTIGGQTAEVVYQGTAPGLVNGVMEMDVRIPANIQAGSSVPVTLMVGDTPAQNTVTVAVK